MKKIISIPPTYFNLSVILIVLLYFAVPEANLIKYPFNIIGLFLMFFGVFLVLRAWQLFKKHNTPESFKKATYLVAEGLYKYSRNPMYLGFIILLLGLSITVTNLISFIFPVMFFLSMHFIFVPVEEKTMEEIFGQKYLEYKKRVKRWI